MAGKKAQAKTTVDVIRRRLKELANEKYAAVSRRFFKTGPGEYGEGDRFIGIRVPVLRKIAKEYGDVSLREADTLLKSPIHEERLLALLFLIRLYKKGEDITKQKIYDLYLKRTRFINNWDLVDLSAEHIVGHYLLTRNKGPIHRLSQSRDLWERRISIIATFCYIKRNQFEEALEISKTLLHDREDLIHKAVGWMLREIGKRDFSTEEQFLKLHYHKMPRTMLRYAIERFPEELRRDYLKGRI